ncbi:cyclic pyranopterin monophosphate synthase MoaC [Halobaculum sp. MBLA0143]|uniref:cyclic pyranopterin monophosphate synthase MoaC n=1 Tax=Halobaculum sp. MBLA0143 TaxID=3079933 RepID=UPI0035263C5E
MSDDGDESEGDSDDPTLTHTADGDAQMVDVTAKPDSDRRATARGEIRLRESTVAAVRADEVGKGDVLTTARIAAIRAVKHTWETIPMCHQIPIGDVETDFEVHDDRIVLAVTVATTGQTGCEMEAVQGVTTGLATVLDMVKSAEKGVDGGYDTEIGGVEIVEKVKQY